MSTKTYVYFAVFDFGDDPQVVSAIMGMEPTGAWIKGERYDSASPNARRTHSRWFLESGLDQAEALELHLDALLAKLELRHASWAYSRAISRPHRNSPILPREESRFRVDARDSGSRGEIRPGGRFRPILSWWRTKQLTSACSRRRADAPRLIRNVTLGKHQKVAALDRRTVQPIASAGEARSRRCSGVPKQRWLT